MRTPVSILFTALAIAALATPPKATFSENKGQWPEQVLYRALVPGGAMFVERSAFTFVQFADGPMQHHGHFVSSGEVQSEGKAHAYRVNFVDGRAQSWTGSVTQPHYENYFLGDDPAHWATGCGVFGEVLLEDIWPGIDLRISGKDGVKYDFIVEAGRDPSIIHLRYEGQNGLALKKGAVHVSLSTGEVVEEVPIAFAHAITTTEGDADIRSSRPHDKPVACAYALHGNELTFNVVHDPSAELIIDPVLTFGSYTGSTANNFGFTATYDNDGALYGGGIAFSIGYPVTVGVQQSGYAGGDIDIGISKWTPDGSTLEWSTYLGGSNNETPTSLVVNDDNELFVLVITGSSNYPTSAGCFDPTFNGGPTIPVSGGFVNLAGGEGYGFSSGTDIAVTHFNATCTALIGSTFVGGTGNDGLNQSPALVHNYGDHFRGEIALDGNQAPVVASSTQSINFPSTAGVPQNASGGGVQDAVLFRLDPALTAMQFATYYGGSGDESGYGVQFASNGEVFLTGGTSSGNLPMAGTPFDASYGGQNDGYIARYAPNGGTLLSATYVGTSAYDETYFVQLNTSDEVYVVGQTHGAYPITPGKYSNPGSAQFIHKFSPDLSTSLWSTRIGNGSGTEDLAPSAFLVSDCGQIYFSAWGGTVNANVLATQSTTAGLPLTSNAFQSTTDGSDYYLMVLEPEAMALNYATYVGGGLSGEHVDGGTSRFDKNGNVYQAVCAGCWNNSDFPTTPGAWSNTNNGGPGACNLAVFKFDLSPAQAVIGINGPSTICQNGTAQFTNTSVGGTDYLWDFGDNTNASTAQAPSHTFNTAGDFDVTMILTDSSGCVSSDTAHLLITVLPPPVATADVVAPICPGGTVQFQAHGGTGYHWTPATGLNNAFIADPISTPPSSILYSVVVSATCGTDTAQVDVQVIVPQTTLTPDTSTCLGGSVVLQATGGAVYSWSPIASLDNAAIGTPNATPDNTTTYTVVITTPDGCVVTDSVIVGVFSAPPVPQLLDTTICFGTSVQLIAGPANSYSWHPANGISTLSVGSPNVSPTVPTLYIVDLINACGSLTDSAFVDLIFVYASAWPDTLVCPGHPVQLGAAGGVRYLWTPAAGLTSDTLADPVATPTASSSYQLVAFDTVGCTDTAFVAIELNPWPAVLAGPDRVIDYGDVVQLTATGGGVLTWTPTAQLSDSTSASPWVRPEESTTYTVTVTDSLGCTKTDVLVIIVTGSLYVPNTFTPNGDMYNDTFGALGKEIEDFELFVFDRWGQLIWSTKQLNGRWDGTYKGVESPIDTYVWKLSAKEFSGRNREAVGHVNLVR